MPARGHDRVAVDMLRSQREPAAAAAQCQASPHCQASPVPKHSRDGAAADDAVATLGRASADGERPMRVVDGDVHPSPGDGGTIAISDADNMTNMSTGMADESQTVPTEHGKYTYS